MKIFTHDMIMYSTERISDQHIFCNRFLSNVNMHVFLDFLKQLLE